MTTATVVGTEVDKDEVERRCSQRSTERSVPLMVSREADVVLKRYDGYLRSFRGVSGVTCRMWQGRPMLCVFVSGADSAASIPAEVDGIAVEVVDITSPERF